MKIERRQTEKFKSVRHGQVFEYEGNVYIRTKILDDEGRIAANAVNLETGDYKRYVDSIEVSLYDNAKVVIE